MANILCPFLSYDSYKQTRLLILSVSKLAKCFEIIISQYYPIDSSDFIKNMVSLTGNSFSKRLCKDKGWILSVTMLYNGWVEIS